MNNESLLYKTIFHIKTITRHKLLVTKLCFKMGLYKQGLLHDISKYSWVELTNGIKYYQGVRSPNDAEKEDKGYSSSWLSHKGKNKHHWEYWIDRTRLGIVSLKMPLNYLKESVCDRVAACIIYQNENYTNNSAYAYFMHGNDQQLMHPENASQMEEYLKLVSELGIDEAFKIIKNDK